MVVAFLLVLLVLVDAGVSLPVPLGILLLTGLVFALGWFSREAFLDARSQGRSVGASLLAGVKGMLTGWWSLGG
jgi:hypothetical protein